MLPGTPAAKLKAGLFLEWHMFIRATPAAASRRHDSGRHHYYEYNKQPALRSWLTLCAVKVALGTCALALINMILAPGIIHLLSPT